MVVLETGDDGVDSFRDAGAFGAPSPPFFAVR
jgi:hypothetical protein